MRCCIANSNSTASRSCANSANPHPAAGRTSMRSSPPAATVRSFTSSAARWVTAFRSASFPSERLTNSRARSGSRSTCGAARRSPRDTTHDRRRLRQRYVLSQRSEHRHIESYRANAASGKQTAVRIVGEPPPRCRRCAFARPMLVEIVHDGVANVQDDPAHHCQQSSVRRRVRRCRCGDRRWLAGSVQRRDRRRMGSVSVARAIFQGKRQSVPGLAHLPVGGFDVVTSARITSRPTASRPVRRRRDSRSSEGLARLRAGVAAHAISNARTFGSASSR